MIDAVRITHADRTMEPAAAGKGSARASDIAARFRTTVEFGSAHSTDAPPHAQPDDTLESLLVALRRTPRGQLVNGDVPAPWRAWNGSSHDSTPVAAATPHAVFCRPMTEVTSSVAEGTGPMEFLKWFPAPERSAGKRLAAMIHGSAARRHIAWADRLTQLGVPVAPLVAAGEFPSTRLFARDSFVVTLRPAGALTLDEAVVSWDLSVAQRTSLADRVTLLALHLHDAGIGRLDLGPDNLLLLSPDGPVAVFDIDRFVSLPAVFLRGKRIRKDLSRVGLSRALLLGLDGGRFGNPFGIIPETHP